VFEFSMRMAAAVVRRAREYNGSVDVVSPRDFIISFNTHVRCSQRHETMACVFALAVAAELAQIADMRFAIAIEAGAEFVWFSRGLPGEKISHGGRGEPWRSATTGRAGRHGWGSHYCVPARDEK
jgi:hypothetical protein